ncbi:MAG: Hsp33 family molecular chaperone HslO [Planctomycetota bacterium]
MDASGARFTTHLSRKRDVLVAVGDPGPLHRTLERHLALIGAAEDPAALRILEDALSAVALYMVSRPRFDSIGWTIHLEQPLRNVFVAGAAEEGSVVGRTFRDGVRRSEKNAFYAQTSRPASKLQTSSVPVEGGDVFKIVEQYCSQSDQQPARLFRLPGGRAAFVSAFPDTDREWLRALEAEEALRLAEDPESKLLSDPTIVFRCGCDGARIAKFLAEIYKDGPDDLFRGDPFVEVECPRCARKHVIARERFDKELARGSAGG